MALPLPDPVQFSREETIEQLRLGPSSSRDADDCLMARAADLLASPVIAPGEERVCSASPDHADIMETIENAADDWRAKGYTSALAEVRDMANVGRALMEAWPEGYSYNNCPSEIVADLINERDEALAQPRQPDPAVERLREAAQAFVTWLDRADDDKNDCAYLNGEEDTDGWDDVRAIAVRTRAALATPADDGEQRAS